MHFGRETDANDFVDLTADSPRNLKSLASTPLTSPTFLESHADPSLPSGFSITEPSIVSPSTSQLPSTASSPSRAETLDLTSSPRSKLTPVKTSTFRPLPRRKERPSRTPGNQVPLHSHNTSVSSLHLRSDEGSNEIMSTPVVLPRPSVEPISFPSMKGDITANGNPYHPAIPSPISKSSSMSSNPNGHVSISDKPLVPSSPASRKPAPYPPGFQPRGVFRVLTDDFLSARRIKREGEGEGGMKRVERTKLERRLEKLINLHFPLQIEGPRDEALDEKTPLGIGGHEHRRASSIFDFQILKNVNLNDASNLWKGVVNGGLRDNTKMEIRGWHLF